MSRLLAATLLIALLVSAKTQAEEPANTWLGWTVKDVEGNNVSLTPFQGKTVHVLVFSSSNDASLDMLASMATYSAEHETTATSVLAVCSDESGADGIKAYLRRQEYKQRVEAWKAAHPQPEPNPEAQEPAEPAEAEDMPDYATEIDNELATQQGLADLVAEHLPIKTVVREEAMWTWLKNAMEAPAGAPRLLKINAQGAVQSQQATTPANWDAYFSN